MLTLSTEKSVSVSIDPFSDLLEDVKNSSKEA
jgi:hypothetical protein